MTPRARCSGSVDSSVNQRERTDSPPPSHGLQSVPGRLGRGRVVFDGTGAGEPWRGGESGTRTRALLLPRRSGHEAGPDEATRRHSATKSGGKGGRLAISGRHLERLIRAQQFSRRGGTREALGDVAFTLNTLASWSQPRREQRPKRLRVKATAPPLPPPRRFPPASSLGLPTVRVVFPFYR